VGRDRSLTKVPENVIDWPAATILTGRSEPNREEKSR
jgi:hypothetical protein